MVKLTEADRRRISEAVARAEERTDAEILCVLSAKSSNYPETPLAWGALMALLGPVILLIAGVEVSIPDLSGLGWSASQVSEAAEVAARSALIAAVVLQAGLFGAVALVLALAPAIRMRLTPARVRHGRVRRRAYDIFLSRNLAATRRRTAVLIYVSAGEHVAELVADLGVAEKVDPEVWRAPMSRLLAGLKAGRAADGFVEAIEGCSAILEQCSPSRPEDNPNEIPDLLVELP